MNATTLPPAANDPAMPRLSLPGRSLPASAGTSWIGEGWKLFTQAPLMWIVFVVLLFIFAVVVSFVPILGNIAFQVLSPVFAAGFIMGCWSLENGGELEFEHLVAGFKRNFANLAILGVIYMVASLAILVVFAAFVGFSLIPALLAGSGTADSLAALGAMGGALIVGTLVCTVLFALLLTAYWFAPALVVMHGMAPIEAMKASFGASWRNVVPFLVYGVIMVLLAIIALIPVGLGMLVWVPLTIASSYRAYRQIFTEDA